jgi:hypothetical protein
MTPPERRGSFYSSYPHSGSFMIISQIEFRNCAASLRQVGAELNLA